MYAKLVTKPFVILNKKHLPIFDRFLVKQNHFPTTSTSRSYCGNNNDRSNRIDENQKDFSLLTTRKLLKSTATNFVDGFTSIETQCPICNTTENNKLTKNCNIFINKTTGSITCPKCQLVTNWSKMEQFFGVPSKSKASKNKDLENLREKFLKTKSKVKTIEISKDAIPLDSISSEQLQMTLSHLEIEFISVKTLENYQCLCDPIGKSLYFPLKNIHNTIVGYRRLFKNEQNQLTENVYPESNAFGLITPNTNKLPTTTTKQKSSSSAILVLTLLDLLALSAHKSDVSIICLPYGLKSLPQQCLPGLEKYQKLILWFECDTISWDASKNFAKKFDEKRCLFVRPTDTTPTPYRAHQQSLDIKQILQQAQPILHKAITTFAALRQDVLSDLQNIDKVQGVKWRRYPTLNKLLKGHRKGELTILTGPTGCGKTTFMSEYSLDLTMQGVTTLWGSFEIRNTRLAATLLRQLAGHPLDDEHIIAFDRWADEFERLPMYFMTFHGQQSIKIVMEAIEHAQYVHDIQHVIIDNVQFMMGTQDDGGRIMDRFWRQDSIIAAFRTFATRRNCHVTLVIHPRKERDDEDLTTSSIFGSAKATQEADNVLIIQDKRLTAIRGKKYLQIAKNRYSGDLGIMPMDFDKYALSYAPKKKKIDDITPKPLPAVEEVPL